MTQSRFPEEKELFEACMAGEKGAWDAFVDCYKNLIHKAILRTLNRYSFERPDQVVSDLFNSVFVSILDNDCKKLRQFQWKCSLSSWLYLIARRVTVDFLRKQGFKELPLDEGHDHEGSVGVKVPDHGPLPDRVLELRDRERILRRIREKLTPKERLLIELCFFRGLPAATIARMLNTSANNVYQMKHRVVERMKGLAAGFL